MALGSAGLSGTGGSHDLYVPEVWSKRIQSAFEKNTVAKEHCTDMSYLLADQGGDIIRVPKLANRTATTRSLTSFAQITPTGATENQFSMNVQTWAVDYESISDALPAKTKIFKKEQLDGKMQQSLAEAFDTSMLANYSSLTESLGDNTGATSLGPDDLFDADERLTTAFVPKSDRVFILSPKTYTSMLKNNTITSMDWVDEKSKLTGRVPTIAGIRVILSQNLPSHANGGKVSLLLHKEAFAFAIAQQPRVREEHDLSWMQTIVVGDMLYGTGCYRAEAGVVMYGK